MQNSGTTSPDLQESIERNTLQMSPQSIFNAAYEKKDGRDGYIDVETTSIGTSFWFTPDLNKDIRLIYTNNRFESVDTEPRLDNFSRPTDIQQGHVLSLDQ